MELEIRNTDAYVEMRSETRYSFTE
jgi:hypothetical protein